MKTLKEELDTRVAAYDHWAQRRRHGAGGHNNRKLWVLACMDERLPIDEALGIHVDTPAGHGDAHRGPGNGRRGRTASVCGAAFRALRATGALFLSSYLLQH